MPEKNYVTEWRNRATALIDESALVRGSLETELPSFRSVVSDYQRALHLYSQTHEPEGQRAILEILERRAERKASIFMQRKHLTNQALAGEDHLLLINAGIAASQYCIAAGKLAEVGLTALTW